jgi:precorrin-2/cobalt-factor-2 C20-methyltransferase
MITVMGQDQTLSKGKLYGIGVGPGDPELISVKGLRILCTVPVVSFPAGLSDQSGIAQQIITPWLRSDQIQVPLTFPYIQDLDLLQQAWGVAAQQVWKYLCQGQDVAFVSEGDVSFYSTFTYLSRTLQHLYPEAKIETIPGICSPLAAAAALGLPLTVQGDRLAILPALHRLADLAAVLAWAEVVVLLKVSRVYPQVWQTLNELQCLDRSYVVVRAGTGQQVIYRDLQKHPNLELPYFSLLVISTHYQSFG